VRGKDGWHERMVGLDEGKRRFGLNPTPIPPEAMPPALADAEPDSVLEVGLAGGEVMKRLAANVARQGGAILAIDYGYARTRTGETLQGVRRHGYADVLEAPGETDLSAHVDFEALGTIATQAGLAVQPLATQGDWLTRMGIVQRAAALGAANPTLAADIEAAKDGLMPAGFAP
jgi:SAM-dependent MidA family methyltransferase